MHRDRELLLLQNALAEGACLLHRAGLTLGSINQLETQCLLQQEIAIWFLETRDSLSALVLAQPGKKASESSAPSAEKLGEKLNWVEGHIQEPNISSQDGPVPSTAPPSKSGEVSGNSSPGGIDPSPAISPPTSPTSRGNSSIGKSSLKLPSFWA